MCEFAECSRWQPHRNLQHTSGIVIRHEQGVHSKGSRSRIKSCQTYRKRRAGGAGREGGLVCVTFVETRGGFGFFSRAQIHQNQKFNSHFVKGATIISKIDSVAPQVESLLTSQCAVKKKLRPQVSEQRVSRQCVQQTLSLVVAPQNALCGRCLLPWRCSQRSRWIGTKQRQ